MMTFSRIKRRLAQSGLRGLLASGMRRAASRLDPVPTIDSHQTSAHKVLSRYVSFEGKTVLEVGGSELCESARPFLEDGAAEVVVTGLDHISQEQPGAESGLRILRADALSLSSVFEPCSFDIVYGLSIVEHIPSPKVFLEEIYRVLKPGGLAYLEGDPVWSCSKGHHLFVATWGGAYQNRATANYLFTQVPSAISTNPLPDWSHLTMTQDQMSEYLAAESIPSVDIECIIDWVYYSDNINRLSMREIAEAYTTSRLMVLEASTHRVDVPREVELALRKQRGDGIDYGICGVSYVLARP